MVGIGLGSVFSQELTMRPRGFQDSSSYAIDFDIKNSKEQASINFLSLGSDLYNLQLANYKIGSFLFLINSRLEEALPYENTKYVYSSFCYFDVGFSCAIHSFSLGLSLENILNTDNKNFSIDPILEQSNGITDSYSFSHETDSLILLSLIYSF